jgi:hypothetical protein
MYQWGEIERLCEAVTDYYKPFAKKKEPVKLFRKVYKNVGIFTWKLESNEILDNIPVVPMDGS